VALRDIRGDIFGAGAAAVITIPCAIAYGLLAFAPLGVEFSAQAAVIGVLSAVFTGLMASLLGGSSILITGPTAPLTLVLSTVVGGLAVHPLLSGLADREIIIIGLASLSVLTAGLVQLMSGFLRFGELVKYIPFPVMAGIMNGMAFLIIVKQIKPLTGIQSSAPLLEVALQPEAIQPLTSLIGVVTVLVIFQSRKKVKVVPGSFVGMLVGTALYYGIRTVAGPSSLGPTLGKINFRMVKPVAYGQLAAQVSQLDLMSLLPNIVLGGIIIGLMGSMGALLTAVVADDLGGTKHSSNRELIGQGAGNVVSSLFGALPGTGSIPRTMGNYQAGGRTRLSAILTPFMVVLLMGVFGPFLSMIPMTVFAAIVVAVGIGMIDKWTFKLVRQLSTDPQHRRSLSANLSVTLIVTVLMVAINLVLALVIGILIASALFMSKVGRSVIRRRYSGDQLRSKKAWSREESKRLDELGKQILVFELQGPLFFGSGESLAKEIYRDVEHASFCILDIKRVTEIDSTGTRIIINVSKSLQKEGKHLFVSYLPDTGPLRGFLNMLGFVEDLGIDRIFTDTDTALERAESELLGAISLSQKPEKLDLGKMDVFGGFSDEEIRSFIKRMSRHEYEAGERIIGNWQNGRDVFFLARGEVSIRIPYGNDGRMKRLVTFSAGSVFGEMAFLDGGPRSAEVSCDEDSEVFTLSYEEFECLSRDRPDLGMKFMRNIATEVSRRLRSTSAEVGFLEDF
jgi:SulP family sulfate permease